MNGDMTISGLNLAVLGIYLAAMLGIGVALARRQQNTEDFFMAGRRMPWLVVAMSLYASLTSAVTFLGLPALAYRQNVSLLAVCVMSPLVAPLLIRWFYAHYHRLRVTTAYEYIGLRYGPGTRRVVSGLFILARLGWLGTVVYAPAMALAAVTGLPEWVTILGMGAVATAYTTLGGAAADIWSDVVQFMIMMVGAFWLAGSLVARVPDGVAGILRVAGEAGRLDVFGWPPGLDRLSVWAVAVSFFFQLLYDYGADQTTVQRVLATPTRRGIARAIVFNAGVDFVIIAVLLFIGLGLFAFQAAHPAALPAGIGGDRLLPFYIMHALPDGVSGLMLAAIFAAAMSSLDSGIGSLSTVIVHDFIRPWRPGWLTRGRDLRLARALTLLFGAAATGVAFYVARFESLIDAYVSLMSLFNGPILALFLLGILAPRARVGAWVAGLAVSIPATLWLQRVAGAHWIYHFPFSFGTAFVTAYGASLLTAGSDTPPHSRAGVGDAQAL